MKKIIIGLIVVFVVFVIVVLVIGRTFYPDNVAATAIDGGAKGLKTRFYKSDAATVSKTVAELGGELTTYGGKWKQVNAKDTAATTIQFEVPVVFFTDDLEVQIKDGEKEGEVRVDVVSKSRVGKSDFGENARHVRKILGKLDEKLSK
jgi:hypothetical protein